MKTSIYLKKAVFSAAIGYFLNVIDLNLFILIKKESIMDIIKDRNVSNNVLLTDSSLILGIQMVGLLIGGIIWGLLADILGRKKVLLYSISFFIIGNLLTSYAHTIPHMIFYRFISGMGIAGELGLSLTLVLEDLSLKDRNKVSSFIVGIGFLGVPCAYIFYHYIIGDVNWRFMYQIIAALSFIIFLMRLGIKESGLFVKHQSNPLKFFIKIPLLKKLLYCLLCGLPAWYIFGILVAQSDTIGKDKIKFDNYNVGLAQALLFTCISISNLYLHKLLGYFKNYKKCLIFCYLGIFFIFVIYFSPLNNSAFSMYVLCGSIGLFGGFWTIVITIGTYQFGTNYRGTANAIIPNAIRAALYGINFLFINVFNVACHINITTSAFLTGILLILLTILGLYKITDTYNKNLDFTD